jgi:hypothetical protein
MLYNLVKLKRRLFFRSIRMSERVSIDEFARRLGGVELPATTQAKFVVKEIATVTVTEPLLVLDFQEPMVADGESAFLDLVEVEIVDPVQ